MMKWREVKMLKSWCDDDADDYDDDDGTGDGI